MLDVLGASMNDGAKLVQHPSNGGHNQIFQTKSCGLPWYCFLNRHSGKALDVPSGTHAENVQIQQWAENDSAAHMWILYQDSDGAYSITNAASGLDLDVRGASQAVDNPVIQFHAKGGANQRWFLNKVSGA